MTEKAVTIRDVARRLNLSITTISRALDGHDDVAEDTRQLVVQTAQEMGYSPNPAARQLRRQQAEAIGFILPAATARFSDPFFAEFISGLSDEATAHNLELIVSTAAPDSPEEQQIYERWVKSRKVGGFVLNRIRLQDWRVQFLARESQPFITLNRSEYDLDHPSVSVSNRDCFKSLVEHLVSLGHQRIGFVGASAGLRIAADRLAGYKDGLLESGLNMDRSLVVEDDLSAEGGYLAGLALLSTLHPPTAVACIDDITAIGLMHAAHELGFQVGSDVAVSGFDGISASAHTQPPLTTVQQPLYHIAQRMVRMLVSLQTGEPLAERQVLIEPRLVLRASTLGTGGYG